MTDKVSIQTARTMQEMRTLLQPAEVLARAKEFFTRRNNIYATFLEREGPTFATFRGQGGEEVVVGVSPGGEGSTLVTGSTYMFDMQVARFLATLPPVSGPEGIPEPTALPEGGS